MISWQDTRAGVEVDGIASAVSQAEFKAITGGPIIAQLAIAKMLWLRTHEPEVFARAAKWLQPQALLLRFLGAEGFFVDIPQAVYYGMWDVAKSQWCPQLLALAGMNADSFGEAVAAGTQVGTLSGTAAGLTGFPIHTPLCVGAGDAACGLVGMGAVATGSASITLGTAGMLTMGVATPRVDLAEFFTLNHPAPGQWMLQAPTLAAASAYRWFRDVFGQLEVAAAARDGSSAFDHLNHLRPMWPRVPTACCSCLTSTVPARHISTRRRAARSSASRRTMIVGTSSAQSWRAWRWRCATISNASLHTIFHRR